MLLSCKSSIRLSFAVTGGIPSAPKPFPLQYISPSSLSLFSAARPLKETQTNTDC